MSLSDDVSLRSLSVRIPSKPSFLLREEESGASGEKSGRRHLHTATAALPLANRQFSVAQRFGSLAVCRGRVSVLIQV